MTGQGENQTATVASKTLPVTESPMLRDSGFEAPEPAPL